MARFDVCRSRGGRVPLLLDCQAGLLSGLETRLVVPLLASGSAPVPARHLNPIFEVGGIEHVMMTQYAAAVEVRELGPRIGSLADRAYEITSALDFLLTGV